MDILKSQAQPLVNNSPPVVITAANIYKHIIPIISIASIDNLDLFYLNSLYHLYLKYPHLHLHLSMTPLQTHFCFV